MCVCMNVARVCMREKQACMCAHAQRPKEHTLILCPNSFETQARLVTHHTTGTLFSLSPTGHTWDYRHCVMALWPFLTWRKKWWAIKLAQQEQVLSPAELPLLPTLRLSDSCLVQYTFSLILFYLNNSILFTWAFMHSKRKAFFKVHYWWRWTKNGPQNFIGNNDFSLCPSFLLWLSSLLFYPSSCSWEMRFSYNSQCPTRSFIKYLWVRPTAVFPTEKHSLSLDLVCHYLQVKRLYISSWSTQYSRAMTSYPKFPLTVPSKENPQISLE